MAQKMFSLYRTLIQLCIIKKTIFKQSDVSEKILSSMFVFPDTKDRGNRNAGEGVVPETSGCS